MLLYEIGYTSWVSGRRLVNAFVLSRTCEDEALIQGCQIKLVSIRFSIWFDIDSIQKRFDSIQSSLAVTIKNAENLKVGIFLKGLSTRRAEMIVTVSDTVLKTFLSFLLPKKQLFCCSDSCPYRIESKIKKSHSIRFKSIWAKIFDSITKYDLISIRFDSPALITFLKENELKRIV
jgi:hypothetical protein